MQGRWSRGISKLFHWEQLLKGNRADPRSESEPKQKLKDDNTLPVLSQTAEVDDLTGFVLVSTLFYITCCNHNLWLLSPEV